MLLLTLNTSRFNFLSYLFLSASSKEKHLKKVKRFK